MDTATKAEIDTAKTAFKSFSSKNSRGYRRFNWE